MDYDKLLVLIADAKYAHDHGAFTHVKQVEFFKEIERLIAADKAASGELKPRSKK